MKQRHIIGLLMIIIFITYSAVTFSNSLTPYVTFEQAKKTNGSVQVRGILAEGLVISLDGGKKIRFVLQDENGTTVPVIYSGAKPDNFEEATSIVAIGKYQDDQFLAEKLLVKCPSKYQGSVKKIPR